VSLPETPLNTAPRHFATAEANLDKIERHLQRVNQNGVLIIATTGRFTTDTIDFIEKHNNSDRAMRIEMWPESHLERLLAQRPGLVVEFHLR
jgi:hypothetical protein